MVWCGAAGGTIQSSSTSSYTRKIKYNSMIVRVVVVESVHAVKVSSALSTRIRLSFYAQRQQRRADPGPRRALWCPRAALQVSKCPSVSGDCRSESLHSPVTPTERERVTDTAVCVFTKKAKPNAKLNGPRLHLHLHLAAAAHMQQSRCVALSFEQASNFSPSAPLSPLYPLPKIQGR